MASFICHVGLKGIKEQKQDCDFCNCTDVHLMKSTTTDMNMECFITDLPEEHNLLEGVNLVTNLFKESPLLAYVDGKSNTVHILPNPGKLLQTFIERFAHLCVEESLLKNQSFFVITDQEKTTFYCDENEELADGSKLSHTFNQVCSSRLHKRLKYSDLVKHAGKDVDPSTDCASIHPEKEDQKCRNQIQQQNKRKSKVFPIPSIHSAPESRNQTSEVKHSPSDCVSERNIDSGHEERVLRSTVETKTEVNCTLVIEQENQEFTAETSTPVSEYTRDAVQVERKISEEEEKTCGAIKKKDTSIGRVINDTHWQNALQDQCTVHIDETAIQHTNAKSKNHPLSKAGRAKYTLLVGLYIIFSIISSFLSVFEKIRRNAKITPTPEQQQTGLKGRLREILDFPAQSFHYTDIFVYPAKRRGRSTGNFSRAQLQRQVQQQQQEQQAAEQPRHPIQCTEGSEIQDRESRNYDIVTSTRPVFSNQDSATATNAPLPVTPTLNLPYAQERALLDRVQGQGQHGTATGGGRTTPRHPQYQDQTARQRSFTNWPATTHQAPARMIVFGFFYTGREDLVRCYHCGIGLKDWSDGDEPLFEHIKHAPNCLFLRQLLGEQLLNTYRENLAEAQRNNETARSQGSEPRPAQQPTRRVRHPGMTTLAQRLGTFNEWPQSTGQQPEALANAGLFFTGINDLCRCFTCDGGLQRWDGEDDPWLEHARWFPHCSYVREIKGQDYIDMVQAAAQRAQLEEEESVVVRGLTNLDFQNTDPIETEAAKAVLDMGYSRAAVRLAIHEFNGRNPSQRTLRFTADELVQILVGRQERGEPIPDDDNDSEERGASAGGAQNLPSDPMEENKRLKGILKCIACKENDCNILLLPCTHHRLCEPCAEKVTNCPVCQRRVEERVRTYMA